MTEKSDVLISEKVDIFKSTRVNSLVDIPKMAPVSTGSNLSVITDLDGVLCGYGDDNTHEQNLAKLFALSKIAKSASDLMFYSSRIAVDEDKWYWGLTRGLFEKQSVSYAPFFTKKSERVIVDFIKKSNKNCRVSFDVSLFNKNVGCSDGVYDLSRMTLRKGLSLVMIGSNRIDEKNVQRLVSDMNDDGLDIQNVYSFNTGHRLI